MGSIRGSVYRIDESHIHGHAYNKRSPSPIKVQLLIDGQQINETWAAQFNEHEPELRDGYTAFTFGMKQIWPLLRADQKISIRAEGRLLPIVANGGRREILVGRDGLQATKGVNVYDEVMLGKVINKYGKLQHKVQNNPRWEKVILPEYRRIHETFTERFDKTPFAFHGALLGVARGGEMIPHDNDLDLAYLSDHQDPELVQAEFFEIQRNTFSRHPYATPNRDRLTFTGHGMSITVCWFDRAGELQNSYGVVGEGSVERRDFEPYKNVAIKGYQVSIPANPQALSRYTYGRYWELPDPGWRWLPRYRKRKGTLATRFSQEQVDELLEARASHETMQA